MNQIKPIITEKSMREASRGKYTFRVDVSSEKTSIARQIEALFDVSVTGIQTITVSGKRQKVGKRRAEKDVTSYKKAIVSVKKGQKIDIFDVSTDTEEKSK